MCRVRRGAAQRKSIDLTTVEHDDRLMIIRREMARDADAVGTLVAAAFRAAEHSSPPVEPGGDPGEVALLAGLRDDPGWMPALSMVAVIDSAVVGHVVGSRAHVADRDAVGLGPLSVAPRWQRRGVGSALMHAVLGAADALDEPLVALLGDPDYYRRFGFVPAASVGVESPDHLWGEYFQVRTMSAYDGRGGPFRYAAAFGLG